SNKKPAKAEEAKQEAGAAEPAKSEEGSAAAAGTEAGQAPAEGAAAESAPPAETRELSSVEILWQVPAEAVINYHLRYGTQPDALTHQVQVPVSELEKIDHPEHGKLFRYVIPSVPADQTVYFTIKAENEYG